MLPSRPTAQVYFGEQKVMKIRNFLLSARSAHTPKASEQFQYLSEDFRYQKRLEFLKLVAEGTLHYETIPCLCGSELFDNLTTADRHNIPQFTNLCVHCGLVLNMPRLDHAAYMWLYSSGIYRDIYEGDGAAAMTVLNASERGEADTILAFLAQHAPDFVNRHRILEVGCNAGINLLGLRASGFEVAGVEPDARACAAGNAYGLNIEQGHIENMVGNGDFDLVILIECFEHMDQPMLALERIRSFLKPGGLLYVQHIGLLREMWQNILKFPQIAHPYNYTLGTLAMVCRSAGFELVQGDERIVAIFRYTGTPAPMVPDRSQYGLVRDKFVGIEMMSVGAIYRAKQQVRVLMLQAQQQFRKRFPFLNSSFRLLGRMFPHLKLK